ncbi:TetR/AcrR family transcriptional regulator [Streptosporangium minutum]|uniref:TetR family transcriptional regulator n=1 Tax=Streptosporangium minutum TaxID=569862 RepID=A0A243RE90_9ACTN|nr:TetR/AcrR family transcriptional regulator C-terminal domain-containing protein [Streptosporangium minutum]OUC93028.1 TetR family transcriptional regulator [Streptosporangium minutum]
MTDIPAPPWRKTRRTNAPRAVLSRDLIVAAGLRILDAEGLDAVSMRRVAQELGTGPASLYAHVENKEELLDLIYDEVMGEIQVPEPEPERWLEQLRELIMEASRVFRAYADIAKVGLATIPTGPNALRIADAQLAIMLAGGVPPKVAALMIDRLGLYVCSDAYEGSLYLNRQRASGSDLESFMGEFFGQIEEFYRSLPVDRFPNLVAQIDNLMEAGGTERFEFGLDLLLRGLASHVEAAGPTTKG